MGEFGEIDEFTASLCYDLNEFHLSCITSNEVGRRVFSNWKISAILALYRNELGHSSILKYHNPHICLSSHSLPHAMYFSVMPLVRPRGIESVDVY